MKRMLMALLVLGACTPQGQTTDTATPDDTAAAIEPTARVDEIPAPEGELMVTSPGPGGRVMSPLVVEGFVKSDWVFEGQFPASIEVDGATISEAPARHELPQDGSYPDPTKFRAELVFTVTAETPATLVLKEDMPRPLNPDTDEAGPARTLRIPVTLLPPTP